MHTLFKVLDRLAMEIVIMLVSLAIQLGGMFAFVILPMLFLSWLETPDAATESVWFWLAVALDGLACYVYLRVFLWLSYLIRQEL